MDLLNLVLVGSIFIHKIVLVVLVVSTRVLKFSKKKSMCDPDKNKNTANEPL